jgi:hypothetical protein
MLASQPSAASDATATVRISRSVMSDVWLAIAEQQVDLSQVRDGVGPALHECQRLEVR